MRQFCWRSAVETQFRTDDSAIEIWMHKRLRSTRISRSYFANKVGIGDDIVFRELRARARRARRTRRPIVLPLYIECYFGWFIDEALSSLLARYRLPLVFFSLSLDHRQRLSSLRSLRHTPLSFPPPLSRSLRSFLSLASVPSLWVTSLCHFLSSTRAAAIGRLCISTFGSVLKSEKRKEIEWEGERERTGKRQIHEERDDNVKLHDR